jgi:hypothetical protein
MLKTPDYIEKRKNLCSASVTLNGKAAVVSGVKLDFAKVRSLDGTMQGEWAWETVERVIKNGGRFQL